MAEQKTQGAGAATVDAPGDNTVQVTFLPEGKTVQFEHGKLPYKDHGKEESLLDVALNNGIRLDHACGGNCACTTCHVIVRQGFDKLSEASEQEEDLLDRAPGLTPTSRLACQAVIEDPDAEIVVRVPRFTINQISESR
jgi:ferredoxin, 2Fe-2S